MKTNNPRGHDWRLRMKTEPYLLHENRGQRNRLGFSFEMVVRPRIRCAKCGRHLIGRAVIENPNFVASCRLSTTAAVRRHGILLPEEFRTCAV